MNNIHQFHMNKVVQTTEITPYSRNAREHSAAQIAQIAASIREFGFTNPLLIDEHNVLIAEPDQRGRDGQFAFMPIMVQQKAKVEPKDNELSIEAVKPVRR